MTIANSKTVSLAKNGDITLNRHTGYASGDSVSLTVSSYGSVTSLRVSLTIDEAKALLVALGEVFEEQLR